jgi:galacturan 1,4-alpha-galacturonidase
LAPQDNYESDGQPRDGGWGNVTNIVFDGVDVSNATRAFLVNQNNGNNGSFSGTINLLISEIYVKNFYGTLSGNNTVNIGCSSRNPCFDIYFDNITAVVGSGGATLEGTCQHTQSGGIQGLSGY